MTIIGQARKIRQDMNTITTGLTDEQGLGLTALFELWHTNTPYTVNDRRRHNNVLYKCVQAHTSQASWTPTDAPSLWTRIRLEEYPQWIQPTGAQDAYAMGDKVMYNGLRWISTADANVWQPGVYGWQSAANEN